MEKALFDWPIVLQYDVKAKYRLISRKFFGHEVFSAELNQPMIMSNLFISYSKRVDQSMHESWLLA